MSKQAQDQMKEAQQRQLESAAQLAQLTMASAERLVSLQVELARSLFEDAADNAKALTAAQPEEQMALRGDLARKSTEKLMSFARQFGEVSMQAQSELSRLCSTQWTEQCQSMLSAMKQAGAPTPAAFDAANPFAAFEPAMAQMKAMSEQLGRATMDAMQAAAPKASSASARRTTTRK